MRLAVIVTEYPKTTETFILRDLMTFLEAGVELRVYHVAPYRDTEILHDFAQPTRALARHHALFGAKALRAVLRRPLFSIGKAWQILRAQWAEPVLALKSLAILPQACAVAEDLTDWGADHIHAEFAGHPATVAWIAGRRSATPYSVSCRAHDIFRSQSLLREKLGNAAFSRTVSEFGRSFLLKRVTGLHPDRIHVIHSSVDVDRIPKLGPPDADTFHVLYVGSLQPRKGVDTLLTALSKLEMPEWRCSIAGEGPDRGALEAQSTKLGLTDRVSFLGKQDFQAISDLYRSASVVIAPSRIGPKGRTEGIPNVMIEALAYCRPAISTSVSGIPELIRNGETGFLIEPDDPEALRATITAIHDDPDGSYRIACGGRAFVESAFDLKKNAHRQLALFEQNRRTGATGRRAK